MIVMLAVVLRVAAAWVFASMLNANFVGIRYFNQQYKSSDGLYSNSPWYRENF